VHVCVRGKAANRRVRTENYSGRGSCAGAVISLAEWVLCTCFVGCTIHQSTEACISRMSCKSGGRCLLKSSGRKQLNQMFHHPATAMHHSLYASKSFVGLSKHTYVHTCLYWIPLAWKQKWGFDTVMKCSILAVRLNIQEERVTTKWDSCKSCSLPGELKGIFCGAKILQPLWLLSGTISPWCCDCGLQGS